MRTSIPQIRNKYVANVIKINPLCYIRQFLEVHLFYSYDHCVKSVQIRSYFLSVCSFIWTKYEDLLRKSPHSFRMQENTDQKKFSIWTIFTQWFSFLPLFLMLMMHSKFNLSPTLWKASPIRISFVYVYSWITVGYGDSNKTIVC